MNIVTLTGRLARDPELRQTNSGKNVASFALAVANRSKGADFIECVAWEKLGEDIHRYFRKGQRIGVTGRLSVRQGQTKNGEKRSFTEVVIDSWEFEEKKEQAAQPDMTPIDDDTLPF